MSIAEQVSNDNWTREQLAQYLGIAHASKDQRAEIIYEQDGEIKFDQIQLKDFDWTNYANVIALSFLIVTDDPSDYTRCLFSPKNKGFQLSFGE